MARRTSEEARSSAAAADAKMGGAKSREPGAKPARSALAISPAASARAPAAGSAAETAAPRQRPRRHGREVGAHGQELALPVDQPVEALVAFRGDALIRRGVVEHREDHLAEAGSRKTRDEALLDPAPPLGRVEEERLHAA